MVALTSVDAAPPAPLPATNDTVAKPTRPIGLVPSASMLTGAAIGVIWFWLPLTILIVAVSSIPSLVGFVVAMVVFVYVMRGVARIERVRSEAVFGLGISVSTRKRTHYNGFQAGLTNSGSTSAARSSGRTSLTTTCGWPTTCWPPQSPWGSWCSRSSALPWQWPSVAATPTRG